MLQDIRIWSLGYDVRYHDWVVTECERALDIIERLHKPVKSYFRMHRLTWQSQIADFCPLDMPSFPRGTHGRKAEICQKGSVVLRCIDRWVFAAERLDLGGILSAQHGSGLPYEAP